MSRLVDIFGRLPATRLVGGSGYVRHYVERIGQNGERVHTWTARRVPWLPDPEDDAPSSPPASPPPGWADVGRPGRRRNFRPRVRKHYEL